MQRAQPGSTKAAALRHVLPWTHTDSTVKNHSAHHPHFYSCTWTRPASPTSPHTVCTGMAEVWVLGEELVINTLKIRRGKQPSAWPAFKAELQFLGCCEGVHVCTCFYFGGGGLWHRNEKTCNVQFQGEMPVVSLKQSLAIKPNSQAISIIVLPIGTLLFISSFPHMLQFPLFEDESHSSLLDFIHKAPFRIQRGIFISCKSLLFTGYKVKFIYLHPHWAWEGN